METKTIMPNKIWAQDVSVRWIPTWTAIEMTDEDEKEWGIKYHPFVRQSVVDVLVKALEECVEASGYTNCTKNIENIVQLALEAYRKGIEQ